MSGSKTKRNNQPADKNRVLIKHEILEPDPYELDLLDHKILKQLIEFPETSMAEFERITKIAPLTIKRRMNSPAFLKAFADLTADMWTMIQRAQMAAITRLEKLARGSDNKLALDASKFLMQPHFAKMELSVKNVNETIFKVSFGDKGEISTEKEERFNENPNNTIELLK